MKELKFEELTTKQKLGLVNTAMIGGKTTEEDMAFLCDLIRNRALGSVWVQWDQHWKDHTSQEFVKMVRDLADYPILIMTDAECGLYDHFAAYHNAIGRTGSEKHAYAFGKVTAAVARKVGYNVICNPILDVKITGTVRSLGSDKHEVARLGAAIVRGMHDGGVLSVAKHYPSGSNPKNIDSHMTEGYSEQTVEELIDEGLYAYRELMRENLLDGIMTGHHRFINIDPDAPASLSKPVIDIIRELGFEGFAMTDALAMMGIRAKYTDEESMPLSVAAGNEFAFMCNSKTKFNQEALYAGYEKGIITDERLDEAVKRVLAAQHKVMLMEETEYPELDEDTLDTFRRIDKDSVFVKVDEGLTHNISRDGKHFFALMVRNESTVDSGGDIDVDTFSNGWLYPTKVIAKIHELFPNSAVQAFHQFPRQSHNYDILNESIKYDDVIFLTFTEPLAYTGSEHLTRRVETLIGAMQNTNRVSTLIHFGNPCVLGNLPHIPRYILGSLSKASVEACLEVLAGEYEPKGVLTYDAVLN